MDDASPPNKQEAAMLLLLPFYAEEPVMRCATQEAADCRLQLMSWPTEDLRYVMVDLREDLPWRAGAQAVLTERGHLVPPRDRPGWMAKKTTYERIKDRIWYDQVYEHKADPEQTADAVLDQLIRMGLA